MTFAITVPERIANRLAPFSQTEREDYLNELLEEAWKADDAAAGDAQIEADVHAGKFDAMAAEAHASYIAGRTYPAPSALNRSQNRTPEKAL